MSNTTRFRRPKSISPPFKRVMLAKTSQLGDLVISLPMATALKRQDPACTVIFLTNPRTADAARCCPDVDEVYGMPDSEGELQTLLVSLNIDIFIQVNTSAVLAKAAYEADIPVRIGSLFRTHNWRRCSHLVALSSSISGLNKRLLDLQYLTPLGVKIDDLQEVRLLYNLAPPPLAIVLSGIHPRQFAHNRKTVILSPALITAGSHQWPLASYSQLIGLMEPSQFQWFICGVAGDRKYLQPLLDRYAQESNVTDVVGQFSLSEFIGFIANCDALVAGSTGPLHLAAALGVHTLGLFQSRQVDLQRWCPIGRSASVIHSAVRCKGERRSKNGTQAVPCPCILAIKPEEVAQRLLAWFRQP